MKEVRVQLTDQDAFANYPFPYQIDERVRSRIDGREGVVISATFVGAEPPCGYSKMSYAIQMNDGHLIHVPPHALVKTNAAKTLVA